MQALATQRLISVLRWRILVISMSSPSAPGSLPSFKFELYRDEYVLVLAEPEGVVVRVVRSAKNHPSPQAMEQSYLLVSHALDRHGRTGRGLLVDVRNAIGRNEPEYEAPLRRVRQRTDAGFARIAVLVRTSAGLLQLMRLSEEDGVLRLVTTSEDAAILYLRTGYLPDDVPGSMGRPKTRR